MVGGKDICSKNDKSCNNKNNDNELFIESSNKLFNLLINRLSCKIIYDIDHIFEVLNYMCPSLAKWDLIRLLWF